MHLSGSEDDPELMVKKTSAGGLCLPQISFSISGPASAARKAGVEAAERWLISIGSPGTVSLVAEERSSQSGQSFLFAAPRFGLRGKAPPDGYSTHPFEQAGRVFDDDSPHLATIKPHSSQGGSANLDLGMLGKYNLAMNAVSSFKRLPATVETSTRAPSTTAPANLFQWELRQSKFTLSQRIVKSKLALADANAAEYSPRVLAPTAEVFAEIPVELRGRDAAALDRRWALERFSRVLRPPVTLPLPPEPQVKQTSWSPGTVADLMTPSALERLKSWLSSNLQDIEDMRTNGTSSARQFKPHPLILSESDMVPEARGVIWDLRNPESIVPLDYSTKLSSDLHLDFLRVLMSSCPDKELRDHILRGAHFKADLPMQTVLLPHMKSLAGRVDLVQKEIERLRGLGWHDVFDTIPFFPCRIMPNGAVARKLEPDRFRRTTNASAP